MSSDTSHTIIRKQIIDLLQQRGPGKSICPSEVARKLSPQNWRPLMEAVRTEAKYLTIKGRIKITQGERVLNPHEEIKGFIRLRLLED